DRRYKKEIRPLEGALGAVGRLQGVHFDWRRDEFPDLDFGKGRQIGFIAQEVREVLPELVSEDREGYLSVDYARVTPLLVEAVKELDRKTQELSKQSQRVDQLEKELAQLKAVIASRLPALGEVKLSRK
ncbi:MAG: tail fiber domain-containing protein, partial [Candidatus Zixiibacteriota bacterium]